MWDYLIVTASNAIQAAAYREQLDLRQRLGLLHAVRTTLIVPDPGGVRVGSGGSTVRCLLDVIQRELESDLGSLGRPEAWADVLRRQRILILHAGGDSRRLPAYGPCGKLFVPLPAETDASLPATLFDLQLPVYLDLPAARDGAGQIVIASGDVLLDFDPQAVRWAPAGITGLACFGTPDEASGHGVYWSPGHGHIARFLQKPAPQEQAELGVIDRYGRVLLDIGVFQFDAPAALALLRLCDVRTAGRDHLAWSGPMGEAIERWGLDFYRELACALGSQSTRQTHQQTVRAAGSGWDDLLLERVFDTVSGIACRVQTLPRCSFRHFGTTRQLISSGQLLLRDQRGAAGLASCVSVNNMVAEGVRLASGDAWVEGCRVAADLSLADGNVLVGVDVEQPLSLPPHACLDLLPGRDRQNAEVTFVRCYHDRDFLPPAAGAASTWCGWTLEQWCSAAGLQAADVWDSGQPAECQTLWEARLFPVAAGAGWREWLWLLEPAGAGGEHWQRWRLADRHSLREMAERADLAAFLHRRRGLRREVLSGSLHRRYRADSRFSAQDLTEMLRPGAGGSDVLERVLQEADWQRGHADVQDPEQAFVFARIVHSLGTAAEHLSAAGDTATGSTQPGFSEAEATLVSRQLERWGSTGGTDGSGTNVAQQARRLAFEHVRQIILGSGHSESPAPRSALRSDEIVWGRAPARIDLAGGWSDTPPFSLEHGGCVLNAAVLLNGQPPIQAYARVTAEPVIRVRSIDVGTQLEIRRWDDLLDYRSATGEFSLVKAALVQCGFRPEQMPRTSRLSDAAGFEGSHACDAGTSSCNGPGGRQEKVSGLTPVPSLQDVLADFGGGLELTTLAAIPKGSGLGTSSIMGAVLLGVLHRVMGRTLSQDDLFHAVLRLEQALTTGGGWQDQIGGSVGGLKLITTAAGLVPQATIRYVPPEILDAQGSQPRTLLYYTGLTRLAKNILEQVVGRYLDRDPATLATLQQVAGLAPRCAEAIARHDLADFGQAVGQAWELNKRLDPNSSNAEIETLLARVRPHLLGAKLAGAGGGGFLLMVCRSPDDAAQARRLLESRPPNRRARFFDFAVAPRGLEISVC